MAPTQIGGTPVHHSVSLLQRVSAVGCVVLGLVTATSTLSAQDKRKASPPVLVTRRFCCASGRLKGGGRKKLVPM